MGVQRQRGSKHGYPESAHIVRDYATLKNIAQGFAAGQIKLLILLGGPGKGKGQIVKRAMQAQAPTWFWDQEFFDYLLEKMPLLREPDIRIVIKANDMKQAEIPGMRLTSTWPNRLTY